jgi:hypothetical protein
MNKPSHMSRRPASRSSTVVPGGRRRSSIGLVVMMLLTAHLSNAQTPPASQKSGDLSSPATAPVPLSTDTGLVQVAPILTPSGFDRIPFLEASDLQLLAAYYQKNLADEFFLKGDVSKALSEYNVVLETLRNMNTGSSSTGRNAQRLLIADATYRNALIGAGADFWGGGLTARPGIPAVHLANMRDLLQELANANTEIIESVRKQLDRAVLIPLIRSSTRNVVADLRASLPAADLRRSVEDQFKARVNIALGKRAAIEMRIKQAVSDREAHIRQADQMAAKAGAAMNGAVTAALGVDPSLRSLAEGKGVEKAILSQITDSSLIDRSAILQDLGETLQEASGLNDQIAQVRDLVDKYQGLKSQYDELKAQADGYITDFARLRDVVSNPSAERLLALGDKVIGSGISLPPEIEQYRSKIHDTLPLEAAIEGIVLNRAALLGGIGKIQTVLATKLDWSVDRLGQDVTRQFLLTGSGDFTRVARDTLEFSNISLRNPDERSQIVQTLFYLWPNRLYEELPEELKGFIQSELNEGTNAAFSGRTAKKLGEIFRQLSFDEVDGQIVVNIKSSRVSMGNIPALLWVVRDADFDIPTEDASKILGDYVTNVTARSSDMREFMLANLPAVAMQEMATNLAIKTPVLTTSLRDAVTSALSDESRSRIGDTLTRLEVGNITTKSIAADVLSQLPQSSASFAAKGNVQDVFKDVATRQLAQAALNSALPGLGTVGLAVGDYLNAVAGFDDQMRQVSQLDSEIAKLSEMEIQETAVLSEAIRSLEALRSGAERDEIYRQAAVQQLQDLASAEEAALDAQDFDRELVSRRGPLVFYLAEKLRQEFDAFERSLAIWVSGNSSFRGVLRDLVLKDPNYVRLVLDKDIHLFTWLDRGGERQRGSSDSIYSHWRQLFRLATDVCRDYGCLAGNTVLGSYGQTSTVFSK